MRDTNDSIARTFLDENQDLDRRMTALDALVDADQGTALPLLLEVGGRTHDSEAVLRAVGRALASLSDKGLPVSEFDMRDLTAVSYEAFCEWMPADKMDAQPDH
jgi:hypothetical protein